MSKYKMFTEDFFRKQNIYYAKVEENMFDLVYRGDYKAVHSSIKKGTSVDLRNDQDQTLLQYAVLYNQVKIAKLFSCGSTEIFSNSFAEELNVIEY